jgi:hypothetical protein
VAINRERSTMVGLLGLAALSCCLGLLAPSPVGLHGGKAEQALDLLRVASTAGLAITLLFGPGILWRASNPQHRMGLAYLPLPGLGILIAAGGLAWALAGDVSPRLVCFAIVIPVLGWLLGGLLGAGPEELLEPEERRVLLIVGCVLGLAIARALWSLGPSGELYGGSISRTLEVGDRSDSRISYNVVQLIAHGTKPFSGVGNYYFAPYNFSSRGPFPGLASAPIVFLSGGRPPLLLPNEGWEPFDAQGFMAYRLAMMTFACMGFLALWELTRKLGGRQAARLALLLAATTPFLVHEVWFTWPKLLAASFVFLGAISVIDKRPLRAGLLVGVGYLMHPGALLSLSALGLLALWPLTGANWRRPQLRSALLLLAGAAVSVIAWRLVNGSHYTQGGFIEYFQEAGTTFHPAIGTWLVYRAESIANTLVPMLLPIAFSHNVSINVFGGISPPVIHFFFQYWDGLPFGAGILFFPFLIVSIWRAGKRWKWPVFVGVVFPFVFFAIYWGASKSGLLREGLQWWVLVLFAVVAIQQKSAGFPWLRSKAIRTILVFRVVEVLAVAIGPALATSHLLVSSVFSASDIVALSAMVFFSACLGLLIWSTTPASLENADCARPALPETASSRLAS